MTTNSQDPLGMNVAERLIVWSLKATWFTIQVLLNILMWILKKIPWVVYLALIPFTVLYAYENKTTPIEEEAGIIVYDIPTPTEQRLIDLKGTDWSKADISWYLSVMATKYNVSESTMDIIVQGESQYNDMTKDGDMNIICERTGLPVRARGLVQITECYFPQITDEEARSVPFALEFLAKNMSQGLGVMLWSTHPDRV